MADLVASDPKHLASSGPYVNEDFLIKKVLWSNLKTEGSCAKCLKNSGNSRLTRATLGVSHGSHAIRVANWKRDWIDTLLDRLVDQMCIFLDTSEPILDSRSRAVTAEPSSNV